MTIQSCKCSGPTLAMSGLGDNPGPINERGTIQADIYKHIVKKQIVPTSQGNNSANRCDASSSYLPKRTSTADCQHLYDCIVIMGTRRWVEETADGSDVKQEFSNDFDLRKPLERHLLNAQPIDCISIQDSPDLAVVRDHCSTFLSKYSRKDSGTAYPGRIAIQSLCAPQCGFFEMDWDMVSFIKYLRAMVRSSNAVAVITFPTSVLTESFSKRWQHLADTLMSVRAIPDEDKDLANLLTGYQDMVGLLHVHKVAQINTQVPVILEATTFSLKLQRRRSLVLERLNQAPVDGSSRTSYGSSSSSVSSKGLSLDF